MLRSVEPLYYRYRNSEMELFLLLSLCRIKWLTNSISTPSYTWATHNIKPEILFLHTVNNQWDVFHCQGRKYIQNSK
jgi:hypothetical protein